MKLDTKHIKDELQELAGNEKVRVKLDKTLQVTSSIKQTDHSFDIRLNPSRIRTEQQLERHLGYCRQAITE